MNDRGAGSRGRRVGLFALPVLGMGAATLFTVSLGVLAPFLIGDIVASRTQLGLLASGAYLVAALSAPSVGRLVDGVGVRRSMTLLFVVSASALALLGGAPTYVVALLAAMLAGLGEAANTPITNRVVQSVFPSGSHGIVVAAKQSGVKASHLIAAATLPTTAAFWGWRYSLIVFALVAALGAPLSWLLLRGVDERENPGGNMRSGSRLNPRVKHLAAYAGLMAVGQAPVQTYLPLFGTEAVGMGAQASAMVLAVSSGVAIAARLAWGAASSRLPSLAVTLVIIALGSAVSVALIAAAPWLGSSALWIGAIAFGCTAAVWSTLVYLEVLRTSATGALGRASGLVHMAFLAGFCIAPGLFGWLVDRQGGYTWAWACGIVAFVLAGVVGAMGSTQPHSR